MKKKKEKEKRKEMCLKERDHFFHGIF